MSCSIKDLAHGEHQNTAKKIHGSCQFQQSALNVITIIQIYNVTL